MTIEVSWQTKKRDHEEVEDFMRGIGVPGSDAEELKRGNPDMSYKQLSWSVLPPLKYKNYENIGNALYKMYQLICKGYMNVEMETRDFYYYNGIKVPQERLWMYQNDYGNWHLAASSSRNSFFIDITAHIRYFQAYRTKLRPVKEVQNNG